MASYKFGDRIKTNDGREGVVQEDQESGSQDVKVIFEGDDFAHVVKAEEIQNEQEA